MILDISDRSVLIKHVVRKGADAPFPPPEIQMGQNGLYYSNRGDINVRGNGQDIAEVDLLIIDHNDMVGFAEIVTSASELKELEAEIMYKKRLLGYLFGQATVPFILFSSVDLSRSSILQRLVKVTESTLIVTQPVEEIKSLLTSHDIRGIPRKPVHHPKLISLDVVQPKRSFDYKVIHDLRRDRVLQHMMSENPRKSLKMGDEIPPLAKKVILGALRPSAIRTLWKEIDFVIKEKSLTVDEALKRYSKIVIALDLPGYDPVIYMRSRNKKEYLKMVPRKTSGWRIESKRTPRMTGFFLWLESIHPSVGPGVAEQYAQIFLKMSGK